MTSNKNVETGGRLDKRVSALLLELEEKLVLFPQEAHVVDFLGLGRESVKELVASGVVRLRVDDYADLGYQREDVLKMRLIMDYLPPEYVTFDGWLAEMRRASIHAARRRWLWRAKQDISGKEFTFPWEARRVVAFFEKLERGAKR